MVLSQSLTPVLCWHGRRTWCQESHGQPCARNREHSGGILCLFRSDWGLRWLDVSIRTDASEKGFAFAVREGCRELASEVGCVSERTRFKRSSRSRALRSIAPDVDLESSSSDENEVSLARRASLGLPWVDLSERRLATCGGFCREENIIVFEARSVLYAVRYAESRYPLGRLLIFSDSLALVLALCKGRANTFALLSVMRRIFASGFRAGFCLIVQVDAVRVELFRRGKSLL